VNASPRARRIAREHGLDIAAVTGSGPGGRIVASDVDQAVVTAPEPSQVGPPSARTQVEARPLTTIRRTIARRLTEAWQVPAFQLSRSIDMESAQALLARRHTLEPDVHPTLTDLLAKVCAVALMRHPDANVEYTEDALLLHPSADVGIAVATQRGLVVPVITRAERRTLSEIAAIRARLVQRARAAALEAADLEGGSFTISNLGMFAVEQFTAVLNPPQAMILAVGATQDRVVAVDGNPVVRLMMTAVLTVDHRAVDGTEAAAFLQTVTNLLQEPGLAL
jgi:pyruvate dehydrogenase E2 component (dihydrolipoamide acetyltransferase)